jgi:hypothetical protein
MDIWKNIYYPETSRENGEGRLSLSDGFFVTPTEAGPKGVRI